MCVCMDQQEVVIHLKTNSTNSQRTGWKEESVYKSDITNTREKSKPTEKEIYSENAEIPARAKQWKWDYCFASSRIINKLLWDFSLIKEIYCGHFVSVISYN